MKVEALINEAPTTPEGTQAIYDNIVEKAMILCLERGLDVTMIEPTLFRCLVEIGAVLGIAAVVA